MSYIEHYGSEQAETSQATQDDVCSVQLVIVVEVQVQVQA